MQRLRIAAVAALALWTGPALSAGASCKDEVVAAFLKQHASRAFTMVAQINSDAGPVELTVEYVPPDRMRQKIVAPGQAMPLETVLVGTRAWSLNGNKWEELLPAIAQTMIAQVHEAIVEPPKDVGEYECLGKTAIDGKEYLAYRSVEKGTGAPTGSTLTKPVHRTVYVDPATGLPALNVVAEDKPGAVPIFKGVYAYPTDLVIEGYPDAPLAKLAGDVRRVEDHVHPPIASAG
jgi:hypothetical protein